MPISKWTSIDERKFIVKFDDDGKPLQIKERKIYCKGTPYEGLYNAPYWHAKHHALSGIALKIVEKAKT